ncbi:MAG: DMT family transporter [Planctomycetia bacterium]|nr:DMT family transporter [Planctomycetia bacterium]
MDETGTIRIEGQMSRRQRWIAVLSILGATFGWGSIPVFLKHLTMTRADYLAVSSSTAVVRVDGAVDGAAVAGGTVGGTGDAAGGTTGETSPADEVTAIGSSSLSGGGEGARDGGDIEIAESVSDPERLRETKLDPWTLNGVRYGISALVWLPFLLPRRRNCMYVKELLPGGVERTRSLWRDAVVPSIVNSISQTAYGLSFLYISASTVGFALRLSVIPTIFFGYFLLREERRLLRSRGFWCGTFLSSVGLAGVVQDEIPWMVGGGDDWLRGGVATGMTMIFWGAYSVAVQKKTKCYSSIQSFAVISLYTACVMVIGAILFGDLHSLTLISGRCLTEIVVSSLIGIALGHVLYYYAIATLGSIVASSILLLSPLVTKGLAMAFLGEPLGWAGVFGGAILLAGGFQIMCVQASVGRSAVVDISK